MKTSSLLLILLFAARLQTANAEQYGAVPASDAAMCLSQNVFDAGYLIRFDPNPTLDPQTGEKQMDVKIYQAVPLWQMQQIYQGTLKQIRPGYRGVCEFKFVDQQDHPEVEIDFRISETHLAVNLARLNGSRPNKYSQVVCNPELIAKLSLDCVD